MDIRPHNPKLLLLDGDGKPVPFAHILFYEQGTDIPTSVFVEDTEAETNFVIADDSGFFPSVILHPRKYTLRSFVPMEGVENPSFPDDFVAYESWNLDGGDAPDADETEVAFVSSISALRDVDTSAYSAADVNGVRYALYPNPHSFPDDGGFAIVPNDASGNIWIARIYGGRLPVTLFGADSTGQASSSSAIAAAFSCVAYFAQTPRSPVPMPTAVYFPYGNYKIEEDVSATAPVVFAEFAKITNATDYSLDFHIYDKYTFEGGNDYVFAGNPVVLKYHLSVPHFVDGRLDGGVGAVDAANVGDNAEVFWATSISLQSAASVSIPRVIVPAAGLAIDKAGAASLYIGAFDFTSGGKLDLDGVTGRVEVGCEIRTSQLANAARDWTKLKGPRLVVDEAVSLIANATLHFEEVFVAIAHGVKNETAAPFSFDNDGTINGVPGSIVIQNVLVGRVSPVSVDWTGCGSAEFTSFVTAHGADADFEGVSISANFALSFAATLRRLNLTGDLTSSALLILSGCAVSGNVASKSLRIDGSYVGGVQNACDCEAVGSSIRGNVSLVNDGTSDPITLRLNRCTLSGYIVFNTANPIQDLVVRECHVAHACFSARIVGGVVTPTYSPIVYSWATGVRVNIDISDNTTTDNGSDPLLRSKGIITMDGAEQVSSAYVTKISAKGFIDFLKPNGTDSRILDGIFGGKAICSYDSSSGVSMFTATQYTTDASGAAAIRRRASGTALAFADPWNTQTNW
jgi:hypothetical protein